MKIVLVCRMGSSRLRGKTLMPFGSGTLLAHIVSRIEHGGIDRKDICIATSNLPEDSPILTDALKLGCHSFAGSSENVSARILDAADGANEIILVLGDNPWIDPCQLAELLQCSRKNQIDYAVTATQELPRASWPEYFLPIGTRLQYIRTEFMAKRLAMFSTAEVCEHTSKLFSNLSKDAASKILVPHYGWPADILNMLNISINNWADYQQALVVLDEVGPAASAVDVTKAYMRLFGGG